MRELWWLSSLRMTVGVITDDDIIIESAPIVKVFIGQPISNLESWMKKQGDLIVHKRRGRPPKNQDAINTDPVELEVKEPKVKFVSVNTKVCWCRHAAFSHGTRSCLVPKCECMRSELLVEKMDKWGVVEVHPEFAERNKLEVIRS
jgi:hypothetical protein